MMMKRTSFTAIVLVTTCVAARAVPLGTIDIEHTGYGVNGQLRVWGGGLYTARMFMAASICLTKSKI